VLKDATGKVLSRNVYWLATTVDVNDWDNSTWYNTPVTSYADYKSLQNLKPASLVAKASGSSAGSATVQLQNTAAVPAYFIRLEVQDSSGADVLPAIWTDNYVTLWPGEKLSVHVSWDGASSPGKVVKISGGNVKYQTLKL
jgi:exo-1,4-beta-D-glucosaminidase